MATIIRRAIPIGAIDEFITPPVRPPLLSLIKLIHYGDVPLDRIWFITSLSQRVYDFGESLSTGYFLHD